MQVSDQIKNLQSMDDAELRVKLVSKLKPLAAKCSIKIPDYLSDLNAKPVAQEEPITDTGVDNHGIMLLSTDSYPGRRIVKVHGVVSAATASMFKAKGGLTGILMMNSLTLIGPVNKTLSKLAENAVRIGADAVVGIKYNIVQTGEGGFTVFALGTAVNTEPIE